MLLLSLSSSLLLLLTLPGEHGLTQGGYDSRRSVQRLELTGGETGEHFCDHSVR